MAHRFHDPAPPSPNDPTAFGGHDHHHRFLRRLSGAQVRSASRPEGHLDRTAALAGFCYRANSHRRNQSNLCGMMWVDAALLLLPRFGFLPADDPRIIATIDAVRRELSHDGVLLTRHTGGEAVDGLPPGDGCFLACSFWLCDALYL